ncbi:MAG: hypothetical protein FJW34_24140 [Acidobacteria bacterium]|nr:hypothetical protein [Acidobacteriota bacterium]
MPGGPTKRLHGVKSLIYIDGTELTSANAWSVDVARDTAEGSAFGETWKTVKGGLLGASGSIDTWLEHDTKVLFTAATKAAYASASVMIYPNRTDITDVISFDAFFGAGWAGDMGGIQTAPGSFTVDGAVTLTGFTS